MYFPHAFQKMMVAGYATPFYDGDNTTTRTTALKAGQVGIINAANNMIVDLDATPTYANYPMIYLAQGSTHTHDKLGPFHGGYQETVKSKGINPKYVSQFYKTTNTDPQNHIMTVCADGCELLCGKTYRLRVDIKGSPALRFSSHNLYRVLDANMGCCADESIPVVVDPNVAFLQWADTLNTYPLLKDFVLATVWNTPADLLAGLTCSVNGDPAATSTVTTADTSDLLTGMLVTGTGIPADCYVGTIVPNTSFTLVDVDGNAVLVDVDITAGTLYFKQQVSNSSMTYVKKQSIAIDPTSGDATIVVTNANAAFITADDVVVAAGIPTGTTVLSVGADDSGGTGFVEVELSANATASTNVTAVFETYSTVAAFSPAATADVPDVVACLRLRGAYQSTEFGDCSFRVTDHYEIQPIKIYASVQDDMLNPCAVDCMTISEEQEAKQGTGYGEPLLRELILDKRYRQEPWSEDVRLREVLDDTSLTDLPRSGKYDCYYLLHSVPRKSNPSGMLDSDQYLIKIVIPTANFGNANVAKFETWMETLLASAGNPITCKNVDTGV